MSYQVLARKWRPKSFADLVGQEHVVRALGNALNEQRVHHAYLLTGTRGVGKTTIARILAKSLNCEEGVRAQACGVCPSCQQIEAGRFVDLLEIDAASNTGIDNIREVIENAQYAPSSARFKVYIIDEVHMLSRQAFNAILKTLEEPPAHVKFILATTDPQKVPVTVLSRCLQFSLRNMTAAQVSAHLAHVLTVENIAFEPGALALLARAAQGSMRDALSLLDQAIAYGLGRVEEAGVRAMLGVVDRRYLFILAEHLLAHDAESLLAEGQSLALSGASVALTLDNLALLFYQIAVAQQAPAALLADEDEREEILALAARFSAEDAQLYYQIALQARQQMVFAPDELTALNMALLRMLAFSPASFSRLVQAPEAALSGRERALLLREKLEKKHDVSHDVPSATLPTEVKTPTQATSDALAADNFAKNTVADLQPSTVSTSFAHWESMASHLDHLPQPLVKPEKAEMSPKMQSSSDKMAKQTPMSLILELDHEVDSANAAFAAVQENYFSSHVVELAEQAAHFGQQIIGQEMPMQPKIVDNPPILSQVADASEHLKAPADNFEEKTTQQDQAIVEQTDFAWHGDWAALLQDLANREGRSFASTRAKLTHAEFLRCEGGEFWLKMQQASLADDKLAQKLSQALSSYFAANVQVRFEIGVTSNTPSAQMARQHAAKHQAALETLAQNPCVLALQQHFQASYREGSLQFKNDKNT